MSNDLATLGLEVDSSSAVKAKTDLDNLTNSAAKTEKAVDNLGKSATDGLGKIGQTAQEAGKKVSSTLNPALDKAGDSADKVTKKYSGFAKASDYAGESSAKLAKSILGAERAAAAEAKAFEALMAKIDPTRAAMDRLDRETEQLGKHFDQGRLSMQQYTQALARLEAQQNTGTISAKQQAAALRGVPAQFTDIITSLQGGQAPLTVFLQQGGQLKDMFGGAGNAARAMGQYVMGLVSPLTLAAGAAGVLAVAYLQGQSEGDKLERTLIATGRAAGLSSTQLEEMAGRISDVTGTTHGAVEVLTQLVSKGTIASENFELIATSATRMSKVTGQSVDELVAQFDKIARDPVNAIRELDQQYNFLSNSIYAQIVALQEQGRSAEAANLAEKTYAQAMGERAAEMEQNLGIVERAWKGVMGAAKGAWDAALNIGREDGTAKLIEETQKQIAFLQKFPQLEVSVPGERRSTNNQTELNDYLQFLKDKAAAEKDDAEWAAKDNQIRKDGLQAQDYLQGLINAGRTAEQKRAKETLELEQKLLDAKKAGVAYTKEEEALMRAGIANRYKDPKVAKGSNPLDLGSVNDIQNRLQAIQSTYSNAERELEATQRAGLISQQALSEQKVAIIEQEQGEIQNAYQQQIAALEALRDKSTTTAAQRIQLDQRIADARAKSVKSQQDSDSKLQQLALDDIGRVKKQQEAVETYTRALQAELDTLEKQGLRAANTIGLGTRQQQLFEELNRLEDRLNQRKIELANQYGDGSRGMSLDEFQQKMQALEDNHTAMANQIKKNYDLMTDAQSDWTRGATSAWQDYQDKAQNVYAQTKDAFTNALDGMEDYLVSFITGTKSSMSDLVRSIIADFAKIEIRKLMSGSGSMFTTGGGSGTSGGGIMDTISSLFGNGSGSTGGAGGGSNWLSLANTGKSIYDFFSSGTGSAIANAYQSGGLTGVYNYGASAVSSWFGGAASTTGGVTAAQLGNAVATGADSIASGLGYVAGNSGASATAAGASAGTSAGLSATGAISAGIGGAIAGYQAAGVKGAVTGAGGAIGGAYIGTMILPGIGTIIGAALGSMLGSSVWGGEWQTKDSGLSLGVQGGDLSAQHFEYQKKKGGLFGKNKKRTRYSALDDQTSSALQDTYDTTRESVETLFDRLGVTMNDAVLDGLDIAATQISTQGRTAEEIQEDIKKWFATISDQMVGAITDATGSDLAGYSFEDLTKFVNNLYSVNDALRYLDTKMFEVSVSGGHLAESLSAAAGGLDVLQKNAATYYDAFFSDAEKTADTIDSVTRAFQNVGATLPATREGFRDIVESLDLTTEAGQSMFTTMMSLAGQADNYYKILETQANNLAQLVQQTLTNNLNTAFATAQRSIAKQQARITEEYNKRVEALNEAATAQQNSVSSLSSMVSSLNGALSTMLGTSDQAVDMLYRQATATLTSADAIARAGGSLANFEGMQDALSTVTGNTSARYSDWREFSYDQARATVLISDLNDAAGGQLSTAEQQLAATKQQINDAKNAYDRQQLMLQGQMDLLQAQLDAANGIDNRVLSVEQAIREFTDALKAFAPNGTGAVNADALIDSVYKAILGRSPDAAGAAYWKDQLAAGNVSSANLGQAVSQAGAANGETIRNAYQAILGRDADAAGLAYWQGQVAAGNISDINEAIRAAAIANGQLPKFATGGRNPGGLIVVGEEGPEVIDTTPSHVYNNGQSRDLLSGNSSRETVELLRMVLNALNEQAPYIAANNKHAAAAADLLKSMANGGIRTFQTASA